MTTNEMPEFLTAVCWLIVNVVSCLSVGLAVGFFVRPGLRWMLIGIASAVVILSVLVVAEIVSDPGHAVNGVLSALDALANALSSMVSSLPLSPVSIASAVTGLAIGVLLRERRRPRTASS